MVTDWGGRVGRRPLLSMMSGLAGDLTGVVVVVVLALVFGLTTPYFLTPDNVLNILRQMSVIGVVGIGATLVILIGGIDLSVGSVVLLTGGITGTLILNYGVNPWAAIAAGLGAAARRPRQWHAG
jgi:ribose transport system permease protein